MKKTIIGLAVALAFGVASPAHALFDLWEINEIYKSPDGSVQFIELHTTAPGQNLTNLHEIRSDQDPLNPPPPLIFTFPGNTPVGTTINHHLLIANAEFDALDCGVQSDFTLPDDFLFDPNGRINFVGADIVDYTSLPTDGILSLGPDGSTTAVNSPTNYLGNTCSLDLSVAPPSVPLLSPWWLALLGGLLLLPVAARLRPIRS